MSTSPGSRNNALADWRPGASPEVLRLRAGLRARTRDFFRQRGLLEVETPALSDAAVTDVHLESLVASRHGGEAMGYLHTSPEFAMKRLLAHGVTGFLPTTVAWPQERLLAHVEATRAGRPTPTAPPAIRCRVPTPGRPE